MKRHKKLFAKPKGLRSAFLGWTSLLLQLAGLSAAGLIVTYYHGGSNDWFGLAPVVYGAIAFAGFSLLGLIMGLYANTKRFSLPGLVSVLSGAFAISLVAYVFAQ